MRNTVVLQLDQCEDPRGFGSEYLPFADLKKMPPNHRRLIFDLRDFREYYDSSSVVDLTVAEALRKSQFVNKGGKILVLIDRNTTAHAQQYAARLKKMGATIYGEKSVELFLNYGSRAGTTMSNSDLVIMYPQDAYSEAPKYLPVGFLEPDIHVAQSYDAYSREIDTVLQAALQAPF